MVLVLSCNVHTSFCLFFTFLLQPSSGSRSPFSRHWDRRISFRNGPANSSVLSFQEAWAIFFSKPPRSIFKRKVPHPLYFTEFRDNACIQLRLDHNLSSQCCPQLSLRVHIQVWASWSSCGYRNRILALVPRLDSIRQIRRRSRTMGRMVKPRL